MIRRTRVSAVGGAPARAARAGAAAESSAARSPRRHRLLPRALGQRRCQLTSVGRRGWPRP
eukprot:3482146-Rhodomonas_salina.1